MTTLKVTFNSWSEMSHALSCQTVWDTSALVPGHFGTNAKIWDTLASSAPITQCRRGLV